MMLNEILNVLKNGKEKIAYAYKGKCYSYATVYRFVCNIYKYLLEHNLDKKPIIVYGHKDIYMKACFVASSMAGISYVPIDNSIPNERVNEIISQVSPYCIIGDYKFDGVINISEREICQIMQVKNYADIEKIYMKPQDIYYIIFTSGSTGKPKGVMVTYENISSCIKWLKSITNIKNGVILNQANFSFDLSVADLYLSLVTGSNHYIIENNNIFNFEKTFDELRKSNAELAIMTPSFAEILMLDKKFDTTLLPKLKMFIFCGETLLKGTVEKLYERFKNVKIINCYGPTECTFAVTSSIITKKMIDFGNIPIGKVKDDVEMLIIENENGIISRKNDGDIGEILILGKSVAKGYIGMDNNISNVQFIKYNEKNGYLTGDLGYKNGDNFYFVKRKDKQIKYKGYRVEILDIENNLYDLEYFEKVKVITKENNNEVCKLIAFVKLKDNISIDSINIKEKLRQKLPEYMIPVIRIINEFPINSNGKVDINKLKEEI